MKETRNSVTLRDFMNYCKAHPEERFWQALRNWAGYNFILASNSSYIGMTAPTQDTFYWEGRND